MNNDSVYGKRMIESIYKLAIKLHQVLNPYMKTFVLISKLYEAEDQR